MISTRSKSGPRFSLSGAILRFSTVVFINVVVGFLIALPADSQFPGSIDLDADSADVSISGAAASDLSGYSLATGDINGDGAMDMIVAATNAAPLGGIREGEYDVIWGGQLQQNGALDLASPATSASRILGEFDGAFLSKVTVGDFNNDGYDDILIGQRLAFPDGRAYVVLGSASFPDTVDLVVGGELVRKFYGAPFSSGQLGDGVCSCDMNGDGYDEVILSAPATYVAEVYIVHGSDSLPDSVFMSTQFDGLTRVIDNKVQHNLGRGLACDDINADSYDDLVIGASGVFLDDVGVVSIIYGQMVLPDTVVMGGLGLAQKHIIAENPSDAFGTRVATGDIGDDGKKDVIVSADGADPLGCNNCGEVYVVHDADELPDSTIVSTLTYPITRIIGGPTARNYGDQLHVADLSGDGADDIVISALRVLSDPTSSDRVVVVYGGDLADSVYLDTDTNTTCIIPEAWDDRLGNGMASGDFDGDGIGDLALGADWHDALGRSNAGSTYVFFGVSTATSVHPKLPAVSLFYNRPNPFSSSTVFEYELRVSSSITINVYNVRGQKVATIVSRPVHGPGRFGVAWDGSGTSGFKLPSGIYFYRLQAEGRTYAKKFTILR